MKHDVAIVGAGVVGATLACALGRQDLSVALIEGAAAAPEPSGEPDSRVSAVTPAAQRLFAELGVWAHVPAERVCAFDQMHVWERPGIGEIHFDGADIGAPALGYIVENRVLQWALERRIEALPAVRWHRPMALVDLEVGAQAVRLETDAAVVEAALVVGADGAGSATRRLAGMQSSYRSYEQRAVVANVATERPHRHTAWQRFLPTGPLAFLPLATGESSIVWSTTPQEAERLTGMSEAGFRRELERAFSARLGRVTGTGARASFPLHRAHALEYVAERVALVGDAAHTIHPLAGQGVNLGCYDTQALAAAIADARARGKAYWRRPTLRRYERARRGHNALVQTTMDGFHWLFGSGSQGSWALRNAGLSVTDKVGPLKRFIMREATGLRLPWTPLEGA